MDRSKLLLFSQYLDQRVKVGSNEGVGSDIESSVAETIFRFKDKLPQKKARPL